MINGPKSKIVWERPVRRIIVLPFMMALFFSLVPVVVAPSPLLTEIKLVPSLVELGPEYCIGETFTISSKIYDVSNLAGIGFAIEWNTTYLEYVNHTLMVPVEEHLGGIMHEPVLIVADTVNEVWGTYDCAVAALGGAPFTGSGTVFEITFRVKDQPITPEPDVHFWIEYTLCDVADPGPGQIPPPPQNCHVIIHANPQMTLQVNSFPSGVYFLAEDCFHNTPWSGIFGQGYSVYLMMPENWTYDGVTYLWDRWSDGYEYRTRTVPMINDTTLTTIYKVPVGGTSVSIDFGKFSSWITSTLLLVTVVITFNVKWNRRRKKH